MHRRSDEQEEIVIGSTRYLHHGAMWHPESSRPFRWPASALADAAQDVVLLGTETLSGQECLVVQFVDSSSGTYQRIWIAANGWHVIQRTVVSMGRTVTTRYSAFDSPVRIAPP
jgi:hypothetical protein